MKSKGFSLVMLLILAASTSLEAQDKEAGLFLGISQYQGDLAENRITLPETKPVFGGLFRYYFSPKLSFKGSIQYGWVSGDDEYTDIEGRNLSFSSHILEGSAQIEYNILPYISNTEMYKWAPYVFTGISVFNFNPKAEFDKYGTVELQPLGTEGQGTDGNPDKYSLTQLSIPMGVGVKYSIGKGWNIGLEVGARKTFTDYLDDVSTDYANPANLSEKAEDVADRSDELEGNNNQQKQEGDQRGGADADDWYTFMGFTVTKTFRKGGCTNFY